MGSIIGIIVVIVLFIISASLMEWKSNKDKELYSCYLNMFYKGFAYGSECSGKADSDPESSKCKHCYYHKLYLKRNRQIGDT